MIVIQEDKRKDMIDLSDNHENQSNCQSFKKISPLFTEFLKYLNKINIKSEDYFKKFLEKILQCKKEEYNNCYNLFWEALKDMDKDNDNDNDYENEYLKSILELYEKFEQIKKKFDNLDNYEKIVYFFLDYLLYNLIKNSNENENDSSEKIVEGKTLEEVILLYEEKKKNISDYLKSFLYNFYSIIIKNNKNNKNKSNEYQVMHYNYLVCIVNKIKNLKKKNNVILLDDFFNYWYKEIGQFYFTPKYMHILFIQNNDNFKIKYKKAITIKCYNNNMKEMEVNYTLYFEIKDNEDDEDYESDNSDSNNEKISINSDDLYNESHKIIMLIYKMNNDTCEK